jgi:hypothetical protein
MDFRNKMTLTGRTIKQILSKEILIFNTPIREPTPLDIITFILK